MPAKAGQRIRVVPDCTCVLRENPRTLRAWDAGTARRVWILIFERQRMIGHFEFGFHFDFQFLISIFIFIFIFDSNYTI